MFFASPNFETQPHALEHFWENGSFLPSFPSYQKASQKPPPRDALSFVSGLRFGKAATANWCLVMAVNVPKAKRSDLEEHPTTTTTTATTTTTRKPPPEPENHHHQNKTEDILGYLPPQAEEISMEKKI